MTNPQTLWTISIIAQVDDDPENGNVWEYDILEQTIKKNRADNLRYVIFKFNQNKNSHEIITYNKSDAKEGDKYLLGTGSTRNTENTESLLLDTTLLEKFFTECVFKEEEQGYILITWGHSTGFGFFSYDDNIPSKIKENLFKGKRCSYSINEYYSTDFNTSTLHKRLLVSNLSTILNKSDSFYEKDKIAGSDEMKNEFHERTKSLSAENFATVLKKSIEAKNYNNKLKKINLFIANNCWMNLFEVGWAFRNQIDVFAAPQTVIPFGGIHYDKLFNALKKSNLDSRPITPLVLAQNITDNFLLKYLEDDSTKEDYSSAETDINEFATKFKNTRKAVDIRQIAISVNHLEEYGTKGEVEGLDMHGIAGIINKLAIYLKKKLNGPEKKYFLERIDIARNFCGDFTQQGVSFIDFTSFFSELIKSFQSAEPKRLKELYNEFFFLKEKCLLSLKSEAVLFRFMPKQFYSQSPQMFSIFFPPRYSISKGFKEFIDNYTDSSKSSFSEFQKASEWDDFIKVYLECSK